jgi:hypothetical protein
VLRRYSKNESLYRCEGRFLIKILFACQREEAFCAFANTHAGASLSGRSDLIAFSCQEQYAGQIDLQVAARSAGTGNESNTAGGGADATQSVGGGDGGPRAII